MMMTRLDKLRPALLVTLYLLMCNVASAQEDVYINEVVAGNFFGVGARATAMGGAQIAACDDGSALIYNPAALVRVKRIEVSTSLSHQRMTNRTQFMSFSGSRSLSNTRFSGVNLTLPVPTYRGSLVFGFGVNRVKSFDKVFEYQDLFTGGDVTGVESESGGIYQWSVGGAVDLSPSVSCGLALSYYSGNDLYNFQFDSSYVDLTESGRYIFTSTSDDDYSGVGVKLGSMIRANKYLTLGATVEFPTTYTVTQDWRVTEEYITYSPYHDYSKQTEPGFYEYKLSVPYSLGAGLALNIDHLLLAFDVNFTDWAQMEYKSPLGLEEENRSLRESYTDVVRYHAGAEIFLPKISGKLRGGYYYDPIPFRTANVERDRHFITGGAGFLIDRTVTLDLAYVRGLWEVADPDLSTYEEYQTDRFFLSAAYRF
jgi:long-subunit fatty acid transport protein